jgi:hypothetical protein
MSAIGILFFIALFFFLREWSLSDRENRARLNRENWARLNDPTKRPRSRTSQRVFELQTMNRINGHTWKAWAWLILLFLLGAIWSLSPN